MLGKHEAATRFRELMQKRREAEGKVLELLQHPEATAEQLVAANKAAVSVNRAVRKAVTVLRKRWPDDFLAAPWNRPEYDKYQDAEKE